MDTIYDEAIAYLERRLYQAVRFAPTLFPPQARILAGIEDLQEAKRKALA